MNVTAGAGGAVAAGGGSGVTTSSAGGWGIGGSESQGTVTGGGHDGSGGSSHAVGNGGFGSGGSDVSPGGNGGSPSSAGAGGGGGSPCDPNEVVDTSPSFPQVLSATGLYSNVTTYTLAPNVLTYTPQFQLWSDGAEKQRFVELPGCAAIDTSDMDHWQVPVGTKLWKEFRLGGARVETRLIKRFGPGPGDFVFVAYQWNADQNDAFAVPDGVRDANGTAHDIPAQWECNTCHYHAPQHVIGFSAVQLSHEGPGVTMEWLTTRGRLSTPLARPYQVPGNATERAALGYLHANCGHCHNDEPAGVYFDNPYVLELSVFATEVAQTGAFLTAVGVPVERFSHPGITHRIAPGNTAASCVSYRMSVRGTEEQMPPFGTEEVDNAGAAAVNEWISGL